MEYRYFKFKLARDLKNNLTHKIKMNNIKCAFLVHMKSFQMQPIDLSFTLNEEDN